MRGRLERTILKRHSNKSSILSLFPWLQTYLTHSSDGSLSSMTAMATNLPAGERRGRGLTHHSQARARDTHWEKGKESWEIDSTCCLISSMSSFHTFPSPFTFSSRETQKPIGVYVKKLSNEVVLVEFSEIKPTTYLKDPGHENSWKTWDPLPPRCFWPQSETAPSWSPRGTTPMRFVGLLWCSDIKAQLTNSVQSLNYNINSKLYQLYQK